MEAEFRSVICNWAGKFRARLTQLELKCAKISSISLSVSPLTTLAQLESLGSIACALV